MNIQVQGKIKKRLKFIQQKCFELNILEYQFFLLQMSEKITTSGDVEKLKHRIMNDYLLNSIVSRSIMDKYFLELAKLFEPISRSEAMSYPNLQNIIEKNNAHIEESVKQEIKSVIQQVNTDLSNYSSSISSIKEHRDKCLGHNDKKLICNHLAEISSKDTSSIIEILIKLTDSLSGIFKYETFSNQQLKKTKENLSSNTYERIRRMEKDL